MREEGQTVAEYAFLVGLISVALIAVMSATRMQLRSVFSTIASRLSSVVTSGG